MKQILSEPETLEYSPIVPEVSTTLPAPATEIEIILMEVIVIRAVICLLTVCYVQVIYKPQQLFKVGVIVKKAKLREVE